MRRKVLIVDSSEDVRTRLRETLQSEYDVIEAAGGVEALAELSRHFASISAVILDLDMEDMDGYEVLDNMRADPVSSTIPVFATSVQTSESAGARAVSLGALGFLTKPYDPAIMGRLVTNCVKMRNSAAILSATQRDKLTGLLSRDTFYAAAKRMIERNPPGYYVLSSVNIQKFKVINDQYGTEIGDRVLRHVGHSLDNYIHSVDGIAARFSADKFALLFPAEHIRGEDVFLHHRQVADTDIIGTAIKFRIGRFIVDDLTLPLSAMYDRATLAQESIRGRYGTYIAIYDESMRQKLLHEQRLVNDMDKALAAKEFEPWFQPQYNHATGALIGAEALVRWHRNGKLVPPAEFIPVFERNGFIYEMDKYIWESICVQLRDWLSEGHPVLPVSVNISRYDVFAEDFVDVITGLIRRYDIPINLFRLEITESAFSTEADTIIRAVRQLIDFGFTVEIDDFGSGYSSLNTLKDVPAQILKLDMRFLASSSDMDRGGRILESVVRMAKWLGMSVIAEGVEEKSQADYLQTLGCNYIQGYYYAKPMPLAEYEKLLSKTPAEEELGRIETVETYNHSAFWNSQSIDSLIFNSYVGGACVMEYHNGKMEIVRRSPRYTQEFVGLHIKGVPAENLDPDDSLDEKNLEILRSAITTAIETKREAGCEISICGFDEGKDILLDFRVTLRLVAETNERYLMYCVVTNITEMRLAEKNERVADEQLRAILGNVSCGVTAVALKETGPEIIFANDRYFEIIGCTREEFKNGLRTTGSIIHPDDRKRTLDLVAEANRKLESTNVEFRALLSDGGIVWVEANIDYGRFIGIDAPVQLSVFTDITAEKKAAQQEKIAIAQLRAVMESLNGGFSAATMDEDRNVRTVLTNDRYYEMFGYTKQEAEEAGFDIVSMVIPEDRKETLEKIDEMRRSGERATTLTYRARKKNGSIAYIRCDACLTTMEGIGDNVIVSVVTDITEQHHAQELALAEADKLNIVMDNVQCGITATAVSESGYEVLFSNDMFYDLLGYTREGFSGAHVEFFSIVYPADREALHEKVLEASRQKTGVVTECRVIRKDGSLIWARINISVAEVYGIEAPVQICIFSDITAEREQDAKMKLLLSSIPGGIASFAYGPGGLRMLYYNHGFFSFSGYTSEEYEQLLKKDPLQLMFEEDRTAVLEEAELMRKDPEYIGNCFYRCRTKTGECKWFGMSGTVSEIHGDEIILNVVQYEMTAQKEAEKALYEREEAFRLATEHNDITICRYNIAEKTITMTPRTKILFGFPDVLEGVPYAIVRQGDISSDTVDAYVAFYERIMNGEKTGEVRYQRRLNGKWYWLQANFSTMFDETGAPVEAIISFQDITELCEKEAIYKKWQQSMGDKDPDNYSLFCCNLNKDASYDTEEGTLLHGVFDVGSLSFNERARVYATNSVHEEDREKYRAFANSNNMLASYYRGKRFDTMEYREKLPEGGTRWLRLTIELVEYPNSKDIQAYLLYENIDIQKERELRTMERAETDPLTGVLNRAVFEEKVCELLRKADPKAHHALLMMDVDGFKQVNDELGHSVGDQTLIDVAQSLRSILRRDDLLGRLGGDEFMIFLNDIPDEEVAENKARQICALTRKSFSIKVKISACVGIANVPSDGQDFQTLYSKADAAMYHSKRTGKDSFTVYNAKMEDERTEESSNAHRGRHQLLIVDDSEFDMKLLCSAFNTDYTVNKARDGASALAQLRHYGTAISAVLLDLKMPGMDGFDVLEKMQESTELRSIPVIVVSASEDSETWLKAMELGATDFITKPVEPKILRIRTQMAIKRVANERMRATNSLLLRQGSEVTRYKTVLEKNGVIVIELDWINGTYAFDRSIGNMLWGHYDGRKLWQVLLSDMVTDTATVHKMQTLVHDLAAERERTEDSMLVKLKNSGMVYHWYLLVVYKITTEAGSTDKLILTLRDLGREKPEELPPLL